MADVTRGGLRRREFHQDGAISKITSGISARAPIITGMNVGKISQYLRAECESALSESPYSSDHRQAKYAASDAILTELKEVPPAKCIATRKTGACCPNGIEIVNSLMTRSSQRCTFFDPNVLPTIPAVLYASN